MKKRLLVILTLSLIMTFLFPVVAQAALPEGVPSLLEAPSIKSVVLKHDEDNLPYFEAQVFFPQSVLDLDTEKPSGGSVFWEYSVKIDDGAWEDFGGGGYIDVYTAGEEGVYLTAKNFPITFDPIDEGTMTSIDIKSHLYSYRLRVFYYYFENWQDLEPVYSPVSNTVIIGSGAFYSYANEWAKPELGKANEYGLIPEILNGVDMTQPITREEFCELAVILYEKTTGITATSEFPNPFKDTTNPQILKAYALKITNGISATTFEPNTLITREQCAAMLFRAIKAIKPNGDFSIAGVADFPDQIHIATYAIEATKFMSKIGIIKGDSDGNFMPKATTETQIAARYGMATREAATLMVVRSYEKIPTLP